MLWIMDYLEVTLKLSSKDLLSGISQDCGHVADLLLGPILYIFNSPYGAHILRLGHLGGGAIQKYKYGILKILQYKGLYPMLFLT